MSKSRRFNKISNLALAVVLTISMAIPSLGTVLVANASNTVIGWKELGVTEDKEYSTAGQTQPIGTVSTADFTNLQFKGVMNLSGWVKFGFGDNGSSKAFYMQANTDGSVYLKWNNQVIRYLNTPSIPTTMLEGRVLTGVDLIVDIKLAFAKDSTDATKSKGSLTVTLTDLATNTELFTETFSNRVIATEDLEATAWVFTNEESKMIAKPSAVLPEEPEEETPSQGAGSTGTPSQGSGSTGTPSTGNTNKVPATGDFTSVQTLVYVMAFSALVILLAVVNKNSRSIKES